MVMHQLNKFCLTIATWLLIQHCITLCTCRAESLANLQNGETQNGLSNLPESNCWGVSIEMQNDGQPICVDINKPHKWTTANNVATMAATMTAATSTTSSATTTTAVVFEDVDSLDGDAYDGVDNESNDSQFQEANLKDGKQKKNEKDEGNNDDDDEIKYPHDGDVTNGDDVREEDDLREENDDDDDGEDDDWSSWIANRRLRSRLETTSAIIFEDMMSSKDHETNCPVTETNQMSDIKFIRESGIEVKVKLENINLFPVYKDVEHEYNDNSFALKNPGMPNSTKFLREVMQGYCRDPLPDYYQIVLETFKDRITRAESVLCTREMKRLGRCPRYVQINEMFVNRSLNANCSEHGTFPDTITPLANSIVCLDTDHNMLTDIFNISPSDEQIIRVSPKFCKEAEENCDRCKGQDDDDDLIKFVTNICGHVDCAAGSECRKTYAHVCRAGPVICAMGDSYRYTLLPIYLRSDREYKCHLKRQHQPTRFKLTFEIHFNKTGMKVLKYSEIIQNNERTLKGATNSHSDQVAFLNILQTGPKYLEDEIILTGKRVEKSWAFTAESLDYFYGRNPKFHMNPQTTMTSENSKNKDSHKKYRSKYKEKYRKSLLMLAQHISSPSPISKSVGVQFREPFLYNSWNWNDGVCDKNIDNFKPIAFKFSGREVASDIHVKNYSAVLKNDNNGVFYQLKATNFSHSLKVSIHAKASILRWYRTGNSSSMLVVDDLNFQLHMSADLRYLIVKIKGSFSDCPSFVSVAIYNQAAREQLSNYDILLKCPKKFNLTFIMINEKVSPVQTFLVTLDDNSKVLQAHLTYFVNVTFRTCHQLESGLNNSIVSNKYVRGVAGYSLEWTTYLLLLASFLSLFSCVLASYSNARVLRKTEKTKIESTISNICLLDYAFENAEKRTNFFNDNYAPCKMLNKNIFKKSSMRRRERVLTVYCLVKIIFIFSFTCNSILLLARFHVTRDLDNLKKLLNVTRREIEINFFENFERSVNQRLKILAVSLSTRQMNYTKACNKYLELLSQRITYSVFNRGMWVNRCVFPKYVLKSQFYGHIYTNITNSLDSQLSTFLNKYETTLQKLLIKSERKFERIIKNFQKNLWLVLMNVAINKSPSRNVYIKESDSIIESSSMEEFVCQPYDTCMQSLRVRRNAVIGEFKNIHNTEMRGQTLKTKRKVSRSKPSHYYHSARFACNDYLEQKIVKFYSSQLAYQPKTRFSNDLMTVDCGDDDANESQSILRDILLSLEWQSVKVLLCLMDVVLLVHRLTKLYLEITLNYLQSENIRNKCFLLSENTSLLNEISFDAKCFAKQSKILTMRSEVNLNSNLTLNVKKISSSNVEGHLESKHLSVKDQMRYAVEKCIEIMYSRMPFYVIASVGLLSLTGFYLITLTECFLNDSPVNCDTAEECGDVAGAAVPVDRDESCSRSYRAPGNGLTLDWKLNFIDESDFFKFDVIQLRLIVDFMKQIIYSLTSNGDEEECSTFLKQFNTKLHKWNLALLPCTSQLNSDVNIKDELAKDSRSTNFIFVNDTTHQMFGCLLTLASSTWIIIAASLCFYLTFHLCLIFLQICLHKSKLRRDKLKNSPAAAGQKADTNLPPPIPNIAKTIQICEPNSYKFENCFNENRSLELSQCSFKSSCKQLTDGAGTTLSVVEGGRTDERRSKSLVAFKLKTKTLFSETDV